MRVVLYYHIVVLINQILFNNNKSVLGYLNREYANVVTTTRTNEICWLYMWKQFLFLFLSVYKKYKICHHFYSNFILSRIKKINLKKVKKYNNEMYKSTKDYNCPYQSFAFWGWAWWWWRWWCMRKSSSQTFHKNWLRLVISSSYIGRPNVKGLCCRGLGRRRRRRRIFSHILC